MARLGENRYGKSRVRLSRITRLSDRHEFNEWTVHVMLYGDFESSYTQADNSKVLPTDTMKNTVYYVARGSKAETIEAFACELGDYFLSNQPQVAKVCIEVQEKAWQRMIVDGAPEATTFKLGGPELQTAHAERERGSGWNVTSGVDGLTILKTTKSAFTGYIREQVDHAQAGHRPHLRHARHRDVGLRNSNAGLCRSARANSGGAAERICQSQQHERAAHALRHGESRAGLLRRRSRAFISPCPTCIICLPT